MVVSDRNLVNLLLQKKEVCCKENILSQLKEVLLQPWHLWKLQGLEEEFTSGNTTFLCIFPLHLSSFVILQTGFFM